MNITWNISEHGVHAMLGNVNGQHAGIGFWKIQTIHGGWMQERKRRGMYGGRWMTGRLTWNCIDALTKCLFMCICESRERLFLTYNWLFTIASENGVVWDERCARSASRPLKTCARCLIDFSCYFSWCLLSCPSFPYNHALRAKWYKRAHQYDACEYPNWTGGQNGTYTRAQNSNVYWFRI